jgi:hypothetical protein
MPGRSGVTAPITPDRRTTGTIAAPRRQRAGTSCISLSIDHGCSRLLSTCSLIRIPLSFPKNLPLLMFYHVSVIPDQWNVICIAVVVGLQ